MKQTILFASIALLLLAGCQKPEDKVIPSDMSRWVAEMPALTEKLPSDDREALGKYMVRHTLGAAFGVALGASGPGPVPAGTTIRQALAEQRQLEAEAAQKEAAAKALKEKITADRAAATKLAEQAVTVALLGLKPSKEGFMERMNISLGFENKSDKPISGVKGAAVLIDVFGERISAATFSYDKTIPPGKTASWTGSIDQFARGFDKLRAADPEKVKFIFEPQQIVFSDGTKIETPPSE